jgi:hypothetical protein
MTMKPLSLHWHRVPVRGKYGNLFATYMPEVLNYHYKGKLLTAALAMPKKTPILFEEIIKKTHRKICDADLGHEPGQMQWLEKNFVQWVSDMGYHIEFTGDEFELHNAPVVES